MRKKRPPKASVPEDLDDASVVGGVGVDQDFQSVAVVTVAGGGSIFLPVTPAGVAKLSGPAPAVVMALQEAVMARRELLDRMDGLVGELRELGVSWNVIGWCVGTTSEAARQRWS